MGDQHPLAEAGVAGGCGNFGGDAGEVAPAGAPVCFESERNEGRVRGFDGEAELAREVIAKAGGAHFGDGQAAGGDYEGGGGERAGGGFEEEAGVAADAGNAAIQFEIDVSGAAFVFEKGEDLAGGIVAEKLAEGLFVEGDAMLADKGEEVLGGKAGEGGLGEVGVGGEEVLGFDDPVGEVAAAAAGDQNFAAGTGRVFKEQHAAAELAGEGGAEQARRAGAENDDVVVQPSMIESGAIYVKGADSMKHNDQRRGFFRGALAALGLGAAATPAQVATAQAPAPGGAFDYLPKYARAQNYRSLKQSSHDTTGGNADRWPIAPGGTQEIFNQKGPGVITHIWFTIAAQSPLHLKELVLRAYWDGSAKPSIETPIGDFFGLNLGDFVHYESEYLACSPGKSLNCYFAMPFRQSARMTVTNEGSGQVGAFYSNIDFLSVDQLPADALYFHAQYRQETPTQAVQAPGGGDVLNTTGKDNYVFVETRGRGHLMGVTMGWVQNAERWMGEGDDMIFVDDEQMPLIIGTGAEDYLLGSWNFGGRDGASAFAHHQYGAPLITSPERTGGRYCTYRFHGDNPVTFRRYLKHTIEHGHANNRSDWYSSCCFWYQDRPAQDFPALPPVAARVPRVSTPG